MNLTDEITRQITSIITQCAPLGVQVQVDISRGNMGSNQYLLHLVMVSGNRSKSLIQLVDLGYYDVRDLHYLAEKLAEGANKLKRQMLAEIDSDPKFYNRREQEARALRSKAEQHLDEEIAALERALG